MIYSSGEVMTFSKNPNKAKNIQNVSKVVILREFILDVATQ